ncbi:hypothetical protein ABH930_001770 [Kitasatospora sp. GAS204A]|nr:hypothetical protein [Kitasatospora sp. GAS204B]
MPVNTADDPPSTRAYTYAQLHEEQCVTCDAREALAPAGHRTVDSLVWAVVACPEHVRVAA